MHIYELDLKNPKMSWHT